MQSKLLEFVGEMAIEDSEPAYRAIFEMMFVPLCHFSYAIVKSEEDAEEIASDVLFMLWEKRKQILQVRNVRYYLFVSARNKSLNLLKKMKGLDKVSLGDLDVDVDLSEPSPETILLEGELREKLQEAVASLPKQTKLVFNLIKEQDFSYKEVADFLGISTNTVSVHLTKAMKKLSAIMKSEYSRT